MRSGRTLDIREMKPASSVLAHRPASAPATRAGADRRRRILDAAMRLFAASAYDTVQMDDIADAASVAKPTVYRHFLTKEALFVEALEAILAKLKANVGAIAQTRRPRRALDGDRGRDVRRDRAPEGVDSRRGG